MKRIKYFIIDVDGTMTDAGIYYDDHGNELKKFCRFFCGKTGGYKDYGSDRPGMSGCYKEDDRTQG